MLFDLLHHVYPNQKTPQMDLKTKTAWMEVLRPWNYQQVREAALSHARKNPYFPSASELAALCPSDNSRASATFVSRSDVKQQELLARYRELKESRRQAGFPPGSEEAKAAGLSYKDWLDTLERAGLGLETIL